MESVVINSRTGELGTYADWVAAFAERWAGGSSKLDQFIEILSPEIRMIAPGTRPTTGWEAGREALRRTFAAVPDLTARVHRWSATDDVLFIEMTFRGTIAGRVVEWPSVDRILFHDGRAIERVAYFDPRKVQLALLRSPRGWAQLVRRIASRR